MSNVKQTGYIITLDGIKEPERPKVKYDSILQAKIEEAMNPEYLQKLFSAVNPDGGKKFDANETLYLQRQFVEIVPEIMKYWTPDYTAETAFPVETSGNPYAEFLEIREESWNGEAQPAGEANTDMPIVGYERPSEQYASVELEVGWEYTWSQLQKAISVREPLSATLGEAAKDAQDKANNRWALGLARDRSGNLLADPADPSKGVCGLCSSPNISKYITSSDTVDYTGAASSFDGTVLSNWNILNSSGTTNRDKLIAATSAPYLFTGNASAIADTVYLGLKQGEFIRTQIVDDAEPGMTVAKALLMAGTIKQIIVGPELSQVGKNSLTDPMFIYKKDRRIARIKKNMPFTIMPTILTPKYRYRTGTKTRTAGLIVLKKAIAVVKNTGA